MNPRSFAMAYMDHVRELLYPEGFDTQLAEAKAVLDEVKARGAKVLFAGNGASASMASHFALDFGKQAGVRSLAFNDASFITGYANDYGYEYWLARAIEHHADPGDAVVLISSSGQSPNMLRAAEATRGKGLHVLTFSGFDTDNPLRGMGDVNFWAGSRAYNVVEAVHGVWLGLLCDLLVGAMEYSVKDA